MSINVEFCGTLKKKFGSFKVVEYYSLKNKLLSELLINITNNDDIINFINSNPVIIFKNNKKISNLKIYDEIINDGDILKIYFAISGG